jgi:hypothetical protein
MKTNRFFAASKDYLYVFYDLVMQRDYVIGIQRRRFDNKVAVVSGGPYPPSYESVLDELFEEYGKIESIFEKPSSSSDNEEDFEELEELLHVLSKE